MERQLMRLFAGRPVAKRLQRLRRFVLPGTWDLDARPHEDHPVYRDMREIVDCDGDYRSTRFYGRFRRKLSSAGSVTYKTTVLSSVGDIDRLFEEGFLQLVASLKTQGYERARGEDIGRVLIARDGTLLKAGSGRHRFYTSYIVGVRRLPLEVHCVHADWMKAVGGGFRGDGLQRLRQALDKVEADHSKGVPGTSP